MSASKAADFAITGIGMRTSLGHDSVQSCASIRAGITRFQEWAAFGGSGDDVLAIVGSAVSPDLGDRDWVEKFEELTAEPLQEAIFMARLHTLLDADSRRRWGVYLAAPSLERPGVDEENAESFREDLRDNDLFPMEPSEIRLLSTGHAGFLTALRQAMRDLAGGPLDVCVVGGVDSLLQTTYLDWLNQERKLKVADSPSGLIPGEGAAFVVLETLDKARARGAEVLALVTPIAAAVEKESPDGKTSSPGRATAAVLRETVAATPCDPLRIHRVINDLNGERWRFLQWAMACSPALSRLAPAWRLWHPADCFGDVGSATGAMHACIAVRALWKSYAVGDAVLICNASDSGERAAASVYSEHRAQSR